MERLGSMRQFRNRASLLSGYFIILTLGNHGLHLSTLEFLVLWSVVVLDAIVFYIVSPFWTWIEKSLDQSEKSPNLSATAGGSAIRVKVGLCITQIVMVFRDHDFSQIRNQILLFIPLSIIIFEGFLKIVEIFGEKKENRVSNQIRKDLPTILSMKRPISYWNAVTLLIPSATSVLIWVTGLIVLPGQVGIMLCDKLYWSVFSVLVVDFIAEVIHRFDCGNRSLSDPIQQPLPKRRYIANIVRVSVEGLLCYSMIVQITGNPYYLDVKVIPYYLDACEAQCQERSRSILMTMVALSGMQATVAFAVPLCSCLLWIFTG